MRIAVLADVHGNLHALEAVLADVRRNAPDVVVNLGDCVSGPLDAAGTAERLMAEGFLTLSGNHDRQLLELEPAAMGASDAAAHARLRPEHLAWLARLPATARVGDEVLLCHATPADDLTYLLETVTPAGARLATRAEVAERLGPTAERIVLCGHTHLPRVVRLADGRLVVNPGSVGLPAFADVDPFPHVGEAGSPHARYAVVEAGPRPRVELVAVEYDWEAAAREAAAAGRPDWETALRTGYAA